MALRGEAEAVSQGVDFVGGLDISSATSLGIPVDPAKGPAATLGNGGDRGGQGESSNDGFGEEHFEDLLVCWT